MLDLLFHNIGIPTGKGRYHVGVKSGSIVLCEPAGVELPNAREIIEGEGNILLPGLVETHIHLDKAFLTEKSQVAAGGLAEAIAVTRALKSNYTYEDIYNRATRVLERSARFGVTTMRCQVEVDPIIGLQAMEVTLALKEKWRDTIDMQLVVFPQEGIMQQPGTAELMEESLRMGADVVGGIPYNDYSASDHITFVFDLAEKYGKPIDLHIDFSDNPSELNVLTVATETINRCYQGRVAAGHVTSLGSVMRENALEYAERLAKADLQIMCLPATDLYLGGRQDIQAARRGLTPVKLLHEAGVNVTMGTNNMRNAFTPFGTGDPLDIALLLANTAQFGTVLELEQIMQMATSHAARALGLTQYGLAVGAKADLVMVQAERVEDIIIDRPPRLGVWKNGVKKAEMFVETRRF
ncbi:amidohydrolase family protein [Paenibacillus sp. CF384]|uniref:amidohydrolase family protein n=1 Tax=Paenibacillus sp. CF384 TaxID=1884382 RepID=UPI00089A5061|nr:amidohydrolase family protein [Paenibacillus sp. CF384]SDX50691.1 cytosine deaminase [Paenibacillus sp. CF384]